VPTLQNIPSGPPMTGGGRARSAVAVAGRAGEAEAAECLLSLGMPVSMGDRRAGSPGSPVRAVSGSEPR
jgi:hypothetical protein